MSTIARAILFILAACSPRQQWLTKKMPVINAVLQIPFVNQCSLIYKNCFEKPFRRDTYTIVCLYSRHLKELSIRKCFAPSWILPRRTTTLVSFFRPRPQASTLRSSRLSWVGLTTWSQIPETTITYIHGWEKASKKSVISANTIRIVSSKFTWRQRR